uniref:Fanconi anemia group F protein n=1 Tax=Pristiophorus japonicus TaxID=55135 RepID=UPI00398E6D68
MEAILDNLARFAEVLAVARSPWARDWDEAAASRAFEWARYFQHLHSRLAANAGSQAAFRQQRLRRFSSSGLGHPLPHYRCPRFEELGRAEEELSRALLRNPSASAAAFHQAAAWYRVNGGGCRLPASLGRAARAKAAARVLLEAWSRGPGQPALEHPSATETQAEILRQRLEERTRGPERLPEQAACEEVLRRALSGGGGSFLPLAALLTSGGGGGGEEGEAQQPPPPALRWLLGDGRALAAFCRALPSATLSRVAARQPAFCRRYLRFLQDWARAMRYDAGTGEWLHHESPEQDWQGLLQHFGALLQGPPQAKEPTERALSSLKTLDGDFDVRGISIWTDLLLALKT